MALAEIRKAAVFLMSLPEEDAAVVMSKLDPRQVEQVLIEIARIDSVGGEAQQQVIDEFVSFNPSAFSRKAGGLELAQTLGKKALGKDAGGTLNSVRQQIEALPFSFLQDVDTQNLLTFLIDEHPQTIALVLTHISPSRSAELLKGLPPDRQLAVVRRIAKMGQTSPEVIREVEEGLEARLESVMNHSYENAGGADCVAEILNVSDRSTERALMENLAQDDPELVEDIRRLMFVFEDIARLSDKSVQEILKNVETSQWALALKGASEELKNKVLGNMSSRAADMLREEMEYLGSVKLSNVEQMQQQIVDVVRRMEDEGSIDTHSDESEEEFIQ